MKYLSSYVVFEGKYNLIKSFKDKKTEIDNKYTQEIRSLETASEKELMALWDDFKLRCDECMYDVTEEFKSSFDPVYYGRKEKRFGGYYTIDLSSEEEVQKFVSLFRGVMAHLESEDIPFNFDKVLISHPTSADKILGTGDMGKILDHLLKRAPEIFKRRDIEGVDSNISVKIGQRKFVRNWISVVIAVGDMDDGNDDYEEDEINDEDEDQWAPSASFMAASNGGNPLR